MALAEQNTSSDSASIAPATACTPAEPSCLAHVGPIVQKVQQPSVLTVASFASIEECESLITSASRLLASYRRASPLTRQPPRSRLTICCPITSVLLHRVFALVETRLPDLAESLFGQRTGLAEMSLAYSPSEPAVNVYTNGGHFAPHTDKQHLSVLVPLSPEGAFEGGGTAFWAGSHHDEAFESRRAAGLPDEYDENDKRHWVPHDSVVSEPRGTAILFGGDVTHAGLPVVCGTRHLFVMSFTLRPRRAGPAVAPASGCEPGTTAEDGAESMDALADFAEFFDDPVANDVPQSWAEEEASYVLEGTGGDDQAETRWRRAVVENEDGELEEEGPQLRYQSVEPRPAADSPSASC